MCARNSTKINYQGNDYRLVRRFKDKRKAAEILMLFKRRAAKLLPHLRNKMLNSFTKNIVHKFYLFDPNKITESDPTWTIGHKAMTTSSHNIYICLRNKDYSFQPIDLLYFVFLHEMAHIFTDEKYLRSDGNKVQNDHPTEYWATFKFLLQGAVELKQIYPHKYSKINPENYAGNPVIYNPYWDDKLDEYIE